MRQLVAIFAVLLGASALPAVAQKSCAELATLKLEHTTVSVQPVAAGGFTVPAGAQDSPDSAGYTSVPAFCRVMADIRPSKDSDIKVEVWMPAAGWNGKFQGQGNGGFAGSIGYRALAAGVSRGYATAATDTGHRGEATDASWSLGHPEKIVDFGYRGIHEMSEKAKAVITAFYGKPPHHAYFSSCSDGGREGLMEAQRFPDDYDGIVAGAPANFWTHLLAAAAWNSQATLADSASYISFAKLPAVSAAAVASCDALDGLVDGIISEPMQCHFDPAQLKCSGPESDSCLTEPQIIALKKIYAGPQASTGERIFPGYMPGGELGPGGWRPWITGAAPGQSLQLAFGAHFFGDMVFGDAGWDFRKFSLDQDTKLADTKMAATLNATDPALRGFQKRGGKLILYHGWSDAAISPLNSIAYYQSLVAGMGSTTKDFARLFMAPGLQHCTLGPGPNSFGQTLLGPPGDAEHDISSALERWVEKGVAPEKIVATKYQNDSDPGQGVRMTRPLCPYPQVAAYDGTGNPNDAASFICAESDKQKGPPGGQKR
ncbi:MAG TPA: tannase/feruloyl esterase family alpha/beta hydrolase [Terriglobales bacterium]|nr:tannase/feruloyl esterase family alpha/beta hydrolase [Terriglobales bacterium]